MLMVLTNFSTSFRFLSGLFLGELIQPLPCVPRPWMANLKVPLRRGKIDTEDSLENSTSTASNQLLPYC